MTLPALKSRANIPQVLWYQDDGRVVLRIMLVDVKTYFLSVDLDHVRFSTAHDGKVYYLCLYFFGAIVPEKTVHENLGREIKIQFVKAHKFLDWLRLERGTEKNHQIIPDPDRLLRDILDDDRSKQDKIVKPLGDWEDFQEYKIKNRLNIYPDGPDSDEEDSDDERYHQVEDF